MKVCIIGTGYVGLVSGACLAEMGNQVVCVDRDVERIERLRKGKIPFYEPGLDEIVTSNRREKRLSFSTDLPAAVLRSQICFIAVGTPAGDDGSADLSAVFKVAESIAKSMDGYRVIATKSTVPVGTGAKIAEKVAAVTEHPFAVVSNPEFLAQGNAVNDFLKPERVVIGASEPRAFDLMRELYAPFLRTGNPVISMDVASAEMTKYVANAFLATKISFINEMSRLCEKVGADIDQVRAGVTKDPRIGRHYLFPGVGFGGSCLPKDTRALLHTAEEHDCEMPLLAAAEQGNHRQRTFFYEKIVDHFAGELEGRTFALWGMAFKPRTDDMREAPAIMMIQRLQAAGCKIRAYDPQAMVNAVRLFGQDITPCDNAYQACKGADALVVLTEWNEFRRPDYERIAKQMKTPIIFDGRNLYDPEMMSQRGFIYHSIGRATSGIVDA